MTKRSSLFLLHSSYHPSVIFAFLFYCASSAKPLQKHRDTHTTHTRTQSSSLVRARFVHPRVSERIPHTTRRRREQEERRGQAKGAQTKKSSQNLFFTKVKGGGAFFSHSSIQKAPSHQPSNQHTHKHNNGACSCRARRGVRLWSVLREGTSGVTRRDDGRGWCRRRATCKSDGPPHDDAIRQTSGGGGGGAFSTTTTTTTSSSRRRRRQVDGFEGIRMRRRRRRRRRRRGRGIAEW